MAKDAELFKKEFPKEYWQLCSNAIINDVPKVESIAFMPITQADSSGGVIFTDWYYQPSQPDERVRANVLILGKTLRSDALKVTLFKQKRTGTTWSDVAVSQATTTALEDTILTKARAIKVQSMGK